MLNAVYIRPCKSVTIYAYLYLMIIDLWIMSKITFSNFKSYLICLHLACKVWCVQLLCTILFHLLQFSYLTGFNVLESILLSDDSLFEFTLLSLSQPRILAQADAQAFILDSKVRAVSLIQQVYYLFQLQQSCEIIFNNFFFCYHSHLLSYVSDQPLTQPIINPTTSTHYLFIYSLLKVGLDYIVQVLTPVTSPGTLAEACAFIIMHRKIEALRNTI